jgi:hypothetical protein
MSSPAPAPQPAVITLPFGDSSIWSSQLDTDELARHIAWCRASAPSPTAKGKRLEQLVCWLFPHIPGFTAEQVNVFSEDGAQEIDVLFWNNGSSCGFPTFGTTVMAECKNWQRPVDSSDVAWFDWKMRMGGVTNGILLAANGITMNASRRDHAVAILTAANAELTPRRIYVVTLADLQNITSTHDLIRLLKRKSMGLTARDPFA